MNTLNCKGKLLVLDKPVVMGIINTTTDSFFKVKATEQLDAALLHATKMLEDSAAIIDIGGQSTRPGSERISAEEEIQRVVPLIEAIIAKHPEAIISIDTYYSKVAEAAVQSGAGIVNDISSGELDKGMIPTVAKLQVPYISMHMKGNPSTMQSLAQYSDVVKEVVDYFIWKTSELKEAGIKDIIIDPGFGFAKTITHNLQLLKHLPIFKMLERPLLAGISRKATIYKTLNTTPENALNGTTVLNTLALANGATILRVHDVKEAVESIQLFTAYSNA